MSAVTHARVNGQVVDPALDAIAHNLDQHRMLFDPSPEIDSLIEIGNTLADEQPRLAATLLGIAARLAASNSAELACAQKVAGNGEQIARDLRPVDGRQSLKRSMLRLRIRPILDVIADPDADPMAYVRAGRDLHALQREVPMETLLSKSLAHELGQRAELLHRYLRTDGAR